MAQPFFSRRNFIAGASSACATLLLGAVNGCTGRDPALPCKGSTLGGASGAGFCPTTGGSDGTGGIGSTDVASDLIAAAAVYLPLMPDDRVQQVGLWSTRNHGTRGGYALLGDGLANVPGQVIYLDDHKGLQPLANNALCPLKLPAAWLDVTTDFTLLFRSSNRCISYYQYVPVVSLGGFSNGQAVVQLSSGALPNLTRARFNAADSLNVNVYSFHPAVWIVRAIGSVVQLWRDGTLMTVQPRQAGTINDGYHFIGGASGAAAGSRSIVTHDVLAWSRAIADGEIAILTSHFQPNRNNRKRVHLLSGQSNMGGLGSVSDIPSGWIPDADVQLADAFVTDPSNLSSTTWGALNAAASFGPEISFGHATSVVGTWLAKWGRGGFSVASWISDVPGTREVFNGLLREMYLLGCEPNYLSFVLDQGEADVGPGAAPQYLSRITSAVTEIRASTSNASLPFVTSTLSNSLKTDYLMYTNQQNLIPYLDEVNNAKATYVAGDGNACLLNADGWELMLHNIHRTSAGYLMAGAAYAAALGST